MSANSISLSDLGVQNMDENMRNTYISQMSANSIPNLDDMLIYIQELLQDIETPEMQKLEKTNKKEFEKILTHKYYEKIESIKIINLMLEPERYENLEKLLDMFDNLKKVKLGKTDIQDAHKIWCEKMNEEYLYSKHGGKSNFEKKMAEEMEKNKKN
jgi:hypothetical protein